MMLSMSLLRSTILLCFWLWLLMKSVICGSYEEPLVEEGRAFPMSCTGNNMSFDKWEIHWRKNYSTIGIGRGSEVNLEALSSNLFRGTSYEGNGYIISNLTILNVTWADREYTYKCNAYEKNGTKSYELGAWKMSRNYYLSSAPPKCEAHKQADQRVHLSCMAIKVFPSIICEPFQIYNGTETNLNISMDCRKYESENYYTVNCSTIVSPEIPGDYKFCVRIKLGVSLKKLNLSCTENVTIISTPTMRISTGNLTSPCPGEQKFMTVECKLLWWSSPEIPTISLYLDNNEIANSSSKGRKLNDGANISSFTFPLEYSLEKKVLKCQTSNNNIKSEIVSDVKEIDFIRLQKPPTFVYKENMKENQTKILVPKGENVSVECTLNMGITSIEKLNIGQSPMNVAIDCNNQSSSKAHSEGTNRAAMAINVEEATTCSCNVKQSSQCAIPSVIIFFEPLMASSFPTPSSEFLNTSTVSISAAFIGLVALCGLIVLILHWKMGCFSKKTEFSPLKRPEMHNQESLNEAKVKPSKRLFRNSRCCGFKTVKSNLEGPYSVVDITSQKYLGNCEGNSVQSTSISHKHNALVNPLHRSAPPTPPLNQPPILSTSETEEGSGFGATDTSPEEKYLLFQRLLNRDTEDVGCLPPKELPPLPPKPALLKNNYQTQEIPIYVRDDNFTVKTTDQFQDLNFHISCSTAHGPVPESLHAGFSEPARHHPPKPCGKSSRVKDTLKTPQEYGLSFSSSKSDAEHEQGQVLNDLGRGSGNNDKLRGKQLSNEWPPPPFRDRKKKSRKKKSPKKSQYENLTLSPCMHEPYINITKNEAQIIANAELFAQRDDSCPTNPSSPTLLNDDVHYMFDASTNNQDSQSGLFFYASTTSLSTVIEISGHD